MPQFQRQTAFSAIVAACLLAATWVCQRAVQAHVPAPEPYHARIRQAAAEVPMVSGSWLASEAPVPPSAVAMLKPNMILSRSYVDTVSGRRAALLLVQCRDVRDLLGHWPPVCYSGQGWVKDSALQRQWQVDDLQITGMQYEFSSYTPGRSSHLSVDDFFILPDGRFCPSMDDIGRHARARQQRVLGAAQVQIVTDGSFTLEQRNELVGVFVRACRPAIDAIRDGGLQ